MKVVILAAGYATRLYPLTLTRPKPLLTVAGKPMIEHVLDNLAPIDTLDEAIIVTNDKFAASFDGWSAQYTATNRNLRITVINDGSTSDENKLGAIGDLHHVIKTVNLDDDLMVVAGDNLFNQPLTEFGLFCQETKAPVTGVYDVGNLDQVKKYAVVSVDESNRIVDFEEKPESPQSTLAGIALYYYPRAFVPMVKQYVDEGNNTDQPGRFVQWLYPKTTFYAWSFPGLWFDIGSKETLEEANRIFAR